MQRTRLNTLVDVAGGRIEEFFSNPWRRISLILISILLGFFTGVTIATTSGQTARWDVVAAGLLLLFTELISRWFYGSNRRGKERQALWVEMLNFFKIGIVYGLFLEAFKLGS
ncbi:MAG: DUF565 domain-containing protein [Microcystaceae cyanobacterium]